MKPLRRAGFQKINSYYDIAFALLRCSLAEAKFKNYFLFFALFWFLVGGVTSSKLGLYAVAKYAVNRLSFYATKNCSSARFTTTQSLLKI
jgi:hypothetical protein